MLSQGVSLTAGACAKRKELACYMSKSESSGPTHRTQTDSEKRPTQGLSESSLLRESAVGAEPVISRLLQESPRGLISVAYD